MNEEKIMILQMLQDGKISPEEAIKLMEALDEPDFKIPEDEPKHKVLTNKTLDEIGSDIGNAFGNLFTSLKGIGSSLAINNLTEILEDHFELDTEDLTNPVLDFKSVNGYINLRKHSLDKIEINVYCKYREGLLTGKENPYKFYVEDNKIAFHPLYNNDISINLDIKVPIKLYSQISLQTSNDHIIINDLDVNSLYCETKNSSIKLSKIKYTDIKLSTQNGRIEGKDLEANDLEAITTNSGILLEDIISEKLNAHTANSKIILKSIQSNSIIAKTSNSTIDTDNLSSRKIDLRTSNAKIIYDFFDMDKTKEIILHTSNSSIISNLSGRDKNIFFDLETSMGNINLEYANLIYKTNKQANFGLKKLIAHSENYDVSEDYIKFSAYTSNGSIKIS